MPATSQPTAAQHPHVVAYYRVSTAGQGTSGLGLEAQRSAVMAYLKHVNHGAHLLAEFTEIESGRKVDRPQLAKALERCKITGATLVIARLDRLSRNACFLLSLQEAKVPFVACDNPHADKFTVGLLALVAQREAETIGNNTRLALQAAKARGVKLGNPKGAAAFGDSKGWQASATSRTAKAQRHAEGLKATIAELQREGISTATAIAAALNKSGAKPPRGTVWRPMTVTRLLERLKTLQ